jgi:hypothetical protein
MKTLLPRGGQDVKKNSLVLVLIIMVVTRQGGSPMYLLLSRI